MAPGPPRPSATVTIRAVAATDVGRRRAVNEDYFAVVEVAGDQPGVRQSQRERTLDGRGAVLVVADGIGGAAEGEVASEMAVNVVQFQLTRAWRDRRVDTTTDAGGDLRAAIEAANREIHAYALERGLTGMGTTVTVVAILDDRLHVGHVGDSRAYLIRAGRIERLTRDQSLVQHRMDMGQLTVEQASESEQRHVLLQALGPEPEVAVDVGSRPLAPDDVVVLCSDGLWSHVGDDEIAAIVATEVDLAAAAERMVTEANARGGADNITVVLARLSA